MAKLQSCGLKVLGDCVLNHRCASQQDGKGVWNQYGGRLDWDARAIVRDDHNFGGKGAHPSLKARPCSIPCKELHAIVLYGHNFSGRGASPSLNACRPPCHAML